MLKKVSKHHLLLHFIVFIWGWSPILGKSISTGTFSLVWYRILFTISMMGLYLIYIKTPFQISIKRLLQLSVIGTIICIHWLCFYGAIKVSNVSVTMAAFSTGTFFTAVVEPIMYKRRFIWYELLIGLIIIGAICLIFSSDLTFGPGILLGALAAFTASLFSVSNGLLIQNNKEPISSPLLSFVELTVALLVLSIYLFFTGNLSNSFFYLSWYDVLFIGLLAGVCTVYPFIASVNLMKHLSPYTINLAVNLEGVYGIILAFIIFKENKELSLTFYIGFSIILVSISLNGFLKQKFHKG